MDARPLVNFTGTWSKGDKSLIREAVAEIERADLPQVSEMQGPPWVATHHTHKSVDIFAASRIGVSQVITAEDATGLAQQIRTCIRSY